MFDETHLASKLGIPAAVVIGGVAFRLLLTAARWTLRAILLHLVAGVLFGFLAGLYVAETPELAGFKGYLLLTAVSVLALDIGIVIVQAGRKFRDNPSALLDLIRGFRKP